LTDVMMPRLDPGMQSGKIVEWLKKEGDTVQKGEPILVVEGEKTTFEVEAPETGPLTKILAEVGTDVEVAQPIAVIGQADRPTTTHATLALAPEKEVSSPPATGPSYSAPSDRVVASPAARRLAQEYGVNLTSLKGTGPGGRITREDILAAKEGGRPAAQVTQTVSKMPQPMVLKRVKLGGIRKVVAERLSYSARTVVPVTITAEADATKLMAMKEKQSHIGFTAFSVKAAAKALRNHADLNSTIENDEITTYSDVNVAVAINTEQGLVAPVIRNADKLSLQEINSAIDDLARRAVENKLGIEQLTGGTFTVTNLGAFDVESFAPVINPPQCAILGLGRIAYKPSAHGKDVVAKPSTLLTLVFDHRITDGVPAAKFLRDIKRNLEDPEEL
jgi:pyruvate dehydrogenase E2 component (dihydrolipoyllysine-residue acetyltransferase)